MPKSKKAYLEITNVCNLACAFCPGTSRTPQFMEESAFLLLTEKLRPQFDHLYFHLMGEPLLHPLLPRFLSHAKRMGFRPMITTNGTLLQKKGDSLLTEDCQPYKISISLHAFEANDAPLSFEDYMDAVLSFSIAAAQRDVYVALRLWNLDGRTTGALHEKNEEVLSRLHMAFGKEFIPIRTGYRMADRIFLEWGDKFDWPSPNGPVLQEEGFCYGLRDQIGVLCDGTVVPCCLDHDGDIPLGNLLTASLEEILSSPRAKAIYDGFTAHRCTDPLCRRCMRAGYYRRAK